MYLMKYIYIYEINILIHMYLCMHRVTLGHLVAKE